METKRKSKKKFIIITLILIITVGVVVGGYFTLNNMNKKDSKKTKVKREIKKSAYRINSNSLEDFDLHFLQLENKIENKVYSPLSIKYALGMLKDGAEGDSKAQIENIIGKYKPKKYINSNNMAFANAMFIKNSYKDMVKKEYSNKLMDKYNAEVIYDSFENPNNVNSWISKKTLNLINNLIDSFNGQERFLLINALAIDMDWQNKFILPDNYRSSASYSHENFAWYTTDHVTNGKFENNNEDIAGMEIHASLNNYDIVNTLGEENIRKTVGDAFREYLADSSSDADYYLEGNHSEENINRVVKEYLDKYINEINENYKRVDTTTDYSIYVDDEVKAFAKDLKEYNNTTLQYVAIMPVNQSLDNYIENTKASNINKTIDSLKKLKLENFDNGVITKITGFIPKFKFEYDLDLEKDLKTMGIKDIFDSNKSNLSGITDEKNTLIGKVLHKSNIEFTQDGIKASAATVLGGYGAAGLFDYKYDVPIKEIDMTFDKPYMFIIRDKNSGEVWFSGTVYNPSLWKNDPDYENFKGIN